MLLAVPVLSQGIPTGTLSGRVKAGEQVLSGVTVTVTSASLQGSRDATTSVNGDYNIPILPPGDYQVKFELQGYQPAQRNVKISAAQATQLDLEMNFSVSEEIVVTGSYETISTSPQVATTYEKKMIEDLPVDRNIRDTVLLTPGVADNGPGGARNRAISISGAMSFENLFLVNGVVVNENIRGQALDLFIEDAIQETTTTTAGISAEYGRFSGGVVNTITKSGGNDLHGSFRTAFTNQNWEAKTPLTTNQDDQTNKRYEATLGGRVIRDRLWYFGAGRNFDQTQGAQTTITKVPYDVTADEKRLEGKLTLGLGAGHRLIGSYIKINRDEGGNRFQNILDTASLVNRSLPEDLGALNYSGVFSDNFVAEAQYSQRKFTFEGSGSLFTDRIFGTLLIDNPTGNRWWSPTFCGVCEPEKRDNKNYLAKGTWFKSTEKLGTHEIALGFDRFDDIRNAENHQSGSDYRVILFNTIIRNGQIFPVLLNDPNGNLGQVLQFNPILLTSKGTSFVTNSVFLNDKWRFNDRLSFNVGVRYDANDGKDSEGRTVAKDSNISPRLSAAYDLKGDGEWQLHSSFARYVAALANSQGDSTSRGGNPATFQWNYRGPSINADPNAATLTTPEEALRIIFDWFDSQGGPANTSNLRAVNIPGGTTIIRGSLNSPSTDEITVGVGKRLGNRGLFRVDVVHRTGNDFYSSRIDRTTGPTADKATDLALLENSDHGLSHKYDGIHTQFQYRATGKISLAGVYTYSHLKGTFDGENAGSGPIASSANAYPEYKQASWNNPEGDLLADQRHRLRLWGIFSIFSNEHHSLNASVLQNYFSGHPYGAVGAVSSRNFVTNPGYIRPPATVTYYYTARDAFHTPNVTATDLSLNYAFRFKGLGEDVEIFLQPEILNAFNEHKEINVSTAVRDATSGLGAGAAFNPFTTTPVEGVNWQKGSTFGKPQIPDDFQVPRTFRFSVGIRF
jgi:outer membrane receptor protein involved in Fe transport